MHGILKNLMHIMLFNQSFLGGQKSIQTAGKSLEDGFKYTSDSKYRLAYSRELRELVEEM